MLLRSVGYFYAIFGRFKNVEIFRHRGPLGKSHFCQILSKCILLVKMHIFGCPEVRQMLLRSVRYFYAIFGRFKNFEIFRHRGPLGKSHFGKFYRRVFCL